MCHIERLTQVGQRWLESDDLRLDRWLHAWDLKIVKVKRAMCKYQKYQSPCALCQL